MNPKVSKRGSARSKPQSRLQEERVSELLDIALMEFVERGFEGASLSEIARRANASKTTFYSRFPTKEELFVAVLDRRMDQVFGEMVPSLPPQPPIADTLKEYGYRLAGHLSSKEHVALFRLVCTELPRFPKLAQRYYDLGAKRSISVLIAYFSEQIGRGRIANEDPTLLAQDFLNFLMGSLRWVIHGFERRPTRHELQDHADGATRVFLRAYPLERPS